MPFVSDGFAKQDPNGSANLTAAGVVDLFTGTPDGTKFLRDDGTLAAGGSGSGIQHATTAGTTTAYTLTPATAITLVEGVKIAFKLDQSCGASPTLNVSGTGAKNMTTPGMVNFAALQLLAEGEYEATYNAANDKWVVTSNFALKAANTPEVLPLAGGALTGSITLSTTAAPGDCGIGRDASGRLTIRGTGNGVDFLSGSTTLSGRVTNTGFHYPSANTTTISTANAGIQRAGGDAFYCYSNSTGSANLLGQSGGIISVFAGSHATTPGMVISQPSSISLANSAQRTIVTSATGRSGFVEIVDLTNHRVARFSINAGVPTKDSGHSQFVDVAPGAGEVAVELSSTTLRVNNNSGGALRIAVNAMLAN